MTGSARDRAGIAMATALGGLVIIGVMIAGVFFTSNQELRVGTNTFVQERAFRAAEFGVNSALASWSNSEMLLLPIGGTKEIVYDSSAQGWRDTVTITRLNATGYLIGSTGTAFGGIQGSSRRRTALLVRLSVPSMEHKAAVIARDDIEVGLVPITGFDTNPPGWTGCPLPDDSAAAIVVADSNLVDFTPACPLSLCLLGAPKLLETASALDTATYTTFGDETWSSLTPYAAKVYTNANKPPNTLAPAVVNGVCDKTNAGNWGDPTRQNPAGSCESYFPIIHAKGSKLTLKGGTGQGILLVDGDLEISTNFSFNGPVIVRGRFESNTGAKVNGTVLVANMNGNNNEINGTSTVTYSSCAIKKAFENALPPKRVIERAWVEVF
jgi:hypothetical protein